MEWPYFRRGTGVQKGAGKSRKFVVSYQNGHSSAAAVTPCSAAFLPTPNCWAGVSVKYFPREIDSMGEGPDVLRNFIQHPPV